MRIKAADKMVITESKQPLAVFHSGVFDSDRREYVITCGYTQGGRFGYFICRVRHAIDGNPHDERYYYTNQSAFYPKENEQTYQTVLHTLGELTKRRGK